MSSKIFNWTDMRRIAKSVFMDVPENVKEIKNWTGTLTFIGVTAYHIIRSLQDLLEQDSNLRQGVYAMLIDTVGSLTKTVDLFPEAERDELMKFIGEVMARSTGYNVVIY